MSRSDAERVVQDASSAPRGDAGPSHEAAVHDRPIRVLLFTKVGVTFPGEPPWDHNRAVGCADPGEVRTTDHAAQAIVAQGKARGWRVEVSGNAGVFGDAAVRQYDVVVFLLTSGDVFEEGSAEREGLQAFVRSGRGVVAVHPSTTEIRWRWFQDLLGGTFITHTLKPRLKPARILVTKPSDPTVEHLPPVWVRADEYYAFHVSASQSSPYPGALPTNDPATNPAVTTVLALDETALGVLEGEDARVRMCATQNPHPTCHPLSWHQHFEGGRSFYTAIGHCPEHYDDPAVTRHLVAAIEWAAGRDSGR